MDICDDLEDKILDTFLISGTGVIPTPALTVRLYTADPGDDPASSLNEVATGTGYPSGGQSVTLGNLSGGQCENTADVEFPEATGAWSGPITHVALYNPNTSEFFFKGQLASSVSIANGDQLVIKAGALVIGVD